MSGKRLNWKKIGCEGELPVGRSGHSLTIDGKKAFLFGGVDKKPVGTAAGPTNDLFVLDMGSGSSEDMKWKWSRPETTCEDAPPLPRWKHSATLLGRSKVFFFSSPLYCSCSSAVLMYALYSLRFDVA
jgi:hypothetical protein